MVGICFQVFDNVEMELIRNGSESVGTVRFLKDANMLARPEEDEQFGDNVLMNGTFSDVFASSISMDLNVTPYTTGSGTVGSSMIAQVGWHKARPGLLTLLAEDGPIGRPPSLDQTLEAKMFSEFGWRDRLRYQLRPGTAF